MATRHTTQIRIRQTTHDHLKEVSERTGVGMAELVERAVTLVPIEEAALADIALVHSGHGSTRLKLECRHQHGLIYVVDGAEMNWVCSRLRRPGHALAGFFGELMNLDESRIKALMQRWGLYYRSLPLAEEENLQVEAADIGGPDAEERLV